MPDPLILQLRHDLAEQLGTELTPDEVSDLMARAVQIYITLDLETYRYMRDLGPGGCWLEAGKQDMPMDGFFFARDIILFVGERKYPQEPRRTDKPSLWDDDDD